MKKPTIKGLQEELARHESAAAELRQTIENKDAHIKALELSQTEHDSSVRELTAQVGIARSALKPFKVKTEKWAWPDDGVLAIAPVTFGDLRAARDAAVKLDA